MRFIKYDGTTMKCTYHDEKNNETFRGGGKFNRDEIVHSYEEQARKDCWMDFDYFYNISLNDFKEKWKDEKLNCDDLREIADGENAVYFLIRDLNLDDELDWLASEFQQDCINSVN